MRKFLALCALSAILPLSSFGQEKPVLALGQFIDAPGEDMAHLMLTMRDRVASDLAQKYDCVVLGRNIGLAIKVERDIGQMSAILNGGQSSASLPAADYAVSGSIFSGKPLGNGMHASDIDVVCVDLRSSSRSMKRETFGDLPNREYRDDAIADAIAKMTGLKPRKALKALSAPSLQERWAVLPFTRMERLADKDSLPDSGLSASALIALQESKRLNGLVEREQLAKLLAELKIESFSSSTEGSAAKIARIAGADKIITGVVTPSLGGGLRIDELLIDAKTSVVLDAKTAECSQKDLSKAAGDLAVSFTKSEHPLPALKSSVKELRWIEAEGYLKTIKAFSETGTRASCISAQLISIFESAYMLSGDDPRKAYQLFVGLAGFAVGNEKDMTQQQKLQVRNIADAMVASASPDFKARTKFNASYASILRIGGDYAAAGKLLDAIEGSPNPDMAWLADERGRLFIATNEFAKAEDYFNKASNFKALATMFHNAGNQDKEYLYLRKIDFLHDYYWDPWMPRSLIDLMVKKEGPAATAEFMRAMLDQSVICEPDIQIKFAYVLAASGAKSDAQQILNAMSSYMGEDDRKKVGAAELARMEKKRVELNAELGPENSKMKTFKQVANLPSKYKIYLQPVEGIDLNDVKAAAALVKDFTGLETVVCPPIPLPVNYAYDDARKQVDGVKLAEAVRYAVKYPADGLFLAIITNDDMFSSLSPNMNFIYYRYFKPKAAASISCARLWSPRSKTIAQSVSVTLLKTLYPSFLENCVMTPCLNRHVISMESMSNLQFVLCRECAAKMKDIDPVRLAKSFASPQMDFNSGDKPLLDEYKAQVQKGAKR